MTNEINEFSEPELLQKQNDVRNKRKAKICMAGVTIFLFVNALLSQAVSSIFVEFVYNNSDFLQALLVKLLGIFGVGKTLSLTVAKNFFVSGGFTEFSGMIISVITLVAPAWLLSKLFKLPSSEAFPLNGGTVKHFLPVFGTMQLFVYFAGSFSSEIYNMIFPESTTDPGGFVDFSGTEFDVFSLIIRFLSVCVFVPLIEEYVFRGVIFGCLRKYGTLYAAVASAAVFGIAHSNPSQSVYALTFGLFSCFLTAVTGSIKTGVLSHAVNNFLSILTEQLSAYAPPSLYSLINGGIYLTTAFLGLVGLYYIVKKDGLYDSFSEICRKENADKKIFPGMSEIFVFPFVIYILIYAANVIAEAF